MHGYYTFADHLVDVRGCRYVAVGKPGVWSWDRVNPGTRALLEVMEIGTGDAVLDVGCGTGIIGAAAAVLSPTSHVTLVDCSLPATICAERTLTVNGITNAEVRLADGFSQVRASSMNVVLSHLPRGRAVQQELIDGAAWVLRPGGRLYFVGSRGTGIKGAIKYAHNLFGRCSVVRMKKGYHVAMSILPSGKVFQPPQDRYIRRTIACEEINTTLVSKPGVFAWDRLDDGTRRLIRAMEIGPADRVLDLGCGTGLVGLSAARRARSGQVVLVDADCRAVESARLTLVANGIQNAEVILSDCASAVFGRRFDAVVTNPPFHQGAGVEFQVAHQFVRDAARMLRPGGRLFLVSNRHLRYAELLREAFGSAVVASADSRYQVLTAESPSHGSW